MITLNEACKKVQSNYSGNRIVDCEDYNDSYGFFVLPKTWNGEKETLPCGSGPIMVNKNTGEIKELGSGEYFEYLLSLEHNPEKINIFSYLSDEDAGFARKVAEN